MNQFIFALMVEKNGGTGDAAVGAEMFVMNLDTHELFAKWMRDIDETRDAAGTTGDVRAVVRSCESGSRRRLLWFICSRRSKQ